jgi:hypothetical protein
VKSNIIKSIRLYIKDLKIMMHGEILNNCDGHLE